MSDLPLGGLVLAGFDGKDAGDPGVSDLVDRGVVGYIVFGRNVEDPEQVQALLSGLNERNPDRPLLLAVDQEGGRVARLRSPLTEWPPMAALGAADDEAVARAVGRALGGELRAVGFNVDFAPVLDVNTDPDNPVIGDRALSDDPAVVARLGTALIQGLQDVGLVACAKHYPGHGHVQADSHEQLPRCDLSWKDLWKVHLKPFRAAAQVPVAAMMTAHVLYSSVDEQLPATLSRRWVLGLLRKEMGYRGLVFSDDLEMGAIREFGSIGEAAVRAIRAGVDGLLVCRNIDAIDEVLGALQAEAAKDERFMQRCKESLARLDAAARAFPPHPSPPGSLGHALGNRTHQMLSERLSDDLVLGKDPTAREA